MPLHINLDPIILGGSRDDPENDPYGFRKWNRRVRDTHSAVLMWSAEVKGLAVWYYPVMSGTRVPPSDLPWYFRHFDCRAPSCLCASQDPDPEAYTEASVFMVTSGSLSGEYVAACAHARCYYWVLIERLFSKRGLPIKTYRPRTLVPPVPITALISPSSIQTEAAATTAQLVRSQVLGRRRCSNYTDDEGDEERPTRLARTISTSLVRQSRLLKATQNTFKCLMKMDSVSKPGTMEREFKSLFRRCTGCNLFMTARAFPVHDCETGEERTVQEVIDLTGDD